MSLKSIRESYNGLINAFATAGVKLDESQKANLDTFIVALESKMSKQKEATVKATKKIVTEHLEKEYKKVFESIMKHQAQNSELAAKIQNKIRSINESKKIASKVSNYLDLYVESVLPKKTIVDYDRMQKLENLHESLKSLLVVNEDAVQAKKAELTESFAKDKKALETQIAKLQVKLNESMDKTQKLNLKLEQAKAVELLESKTKDLPTFEARKMKKRFANATAAEVEAKFDKVLECVQNEIKTDTKEAEVELEAEIKDIIKDDDETQTPVKEDDAILDDENKKAKPDTANIEDADKPFETIESFKYDADGDVILESEDIIDADYMKSLCRMTESLNIK